MVIYTNGIKLIITHPTPAHRVNGKKHAISNILTHLAYRANAKKRVIPNDIVTDLKSREKRARADVNFYCKMTSILALEGVSLFLRLKDATYSCKRMQHSPTIGGIS